MNDPSSIKAEILEKNRQLHDKIKKSQASFDARLQKSLRNFFEIEIPRMKSVYEAEIKEALQDHEQQINYLLTIKSKNGGISIDFSQNQQRFSSNNEDQPSQNIRKLKDKYKESRFFGDNTKRLKDSLNLSQKISLRNDESSKDMLKPSFHELRSVKNMTKPDPFLNSRNKELDLRKRFEKFKKSESSSSSSSLSSQSSNEKKEKKGKKKRSKKKSPENSLLESSSD